jgi:hypothetical protein
MTEPTITINSKQFTLRDISPSLWKYLDRMTYDQVERCGITPEQWEEYCYIWRTSAARFSPLGLTQARAYAVRHGLTDEAGELGTLKDWA